MQPVALAVRVERGQLGALRGRKHVVGEQRPEVVLQLRLGRDLEGRGGDAAVRGVHLQLRVGKVEQTAALLLPVLGDTEHALPLYHRDFALVQRVVHRLCGRGELADGTVHGPVRELAALVTVKDLVASADVDRAGRPALCAAVILAERAGLPEDSVAAVREELFLRVLGVWKTVFIFSKGSGVGNWIIFQLGDFFRFQEWQNKTKVSPKRTGFELWKLLWEKVLLRRAKRAESLFMQNPSGKVVFRGPCKSPNFSSTTFFLSEGLGLGFNTSS